MSVFKAYDIRGVYPGEIDETLARKIGAAFSREIGGGPLVVGRDMRACAPAIAAAFIDGATSQGSDVIDIGLAETPMTYYATGALGVAGSAQVTASHNPARYIGFKFCRAGCVPVSRDTGIAVLEERSREPLPPPVPRRGRVTERDVLPDYIAHVLSFADGIRKKRVVIDAGNGMAGLALPRLLERLPLVADALYFELDGTFPNHEANPLRHENLRDLVARVKDTGADLGVAFDGDADRCAFVDERGEVVPSDLMTALLARDILGRKGPSAVVYDLRSSRVVAEEIAAAGGTPVRERVGHSFIKATMREKQAIFGGELSGHYYFRENFYSDSGLIAMILVLNILSRHEGALSDLVRPLRRYRATGEVNFHVEDKEAMMAEVRRVFADGRMSDLDGVTVEYPTFWFNIRQSNTEPLLRLNLEADDAPTLEAARARVLAVLGTPES